MIRLGPLKVKAQLFCGEENAMGPGKADLLEAIDREGSISAAGRALGMSYRRAWLLIDAVNRCWREPVVDTLVGGGKVRGARLTPFGHELLIAYRALERQLAEEASAGPMTRLAAMLRDEPLPPGAHH